MLITIIDYGVGNLHSVSTAFRKTGVDVRVSSSIADVEAAGKLVLPGVGSLAAGMQHLRERDLLPVLERRVRRERTPILGICLGFQMFTRSSEEGSAAGLGWLPAETRRFPFRRPDEPKVPHLGWNELRFRGDSALLAGIEPAACFYFAHSYCVCCDEPSQVIATSDYGGEFTAAAQADNVYGIQFHPEKSHGFGQRLIANFVERG